MYQIFLAFGMALALALPAWAFPVDVQVQPAEFDIAVGTVDQANMAAVLMTSRESAVLDCRVAFVNGPERPVPRHITLHPGKQEVVSQFFRRAINRVRITIDCE